MFAAVRHLSLQAAQTRLFSRVLDRLERTDPRQPNLLRVLTYHRVDYPDARPGLDPALLSATPETFGDQARYLAEHYRVVSMPEALEAFQGGRPLPPRAVLITFDDAYDCFARHAWPALQDLGLPATLFVPTAYPGRPERVFWWDKLHQAFQATPRRDHLATPAGRLPLAGVGQRSQAVRRLKSHLKTMPHGDAMALVDRLCEQLGPPETRQHILAWDDLRRLAREGVTLGAHTRTHPLLNRLEPDAACAELNGSLEDLRREIGAVLPIFAYPAGGVDDAVVQVLAQAGIVLAFTTRRGINRVARADPLRLRRINVGTRTSLPVLRAELLPWSLRLNRLR